MTIIDASAINILKTTTVFKLRRFGT